MIELKRDFRYAALGKTGSGKTVWVIVLCSMLVPMDSKLWEVWWVDTKDYQPDLDLLAEWGYREWGTRAAEHTPRKLFKLRGDDAAIKAQAQAIARAALARQHVLIVFDEWNHVVLSTQRAGPGIDRLQKSGRGKVGVIGGVQEPVLTPRVLFSQASILAIFNLTHARDIKIAQELCPRYAPGWPKDRDDPLPDKHGFWLKYLDGHGPDGAWRYWRSTQEWMATILR